jgi:hypothetical protein
MLIVPDRNTLGLTLLIDMEYDNTLLPIIEIFPYPNEKAFKQAFLALGNDFRYDNMLQNLSPRDIRFMAYSLPMSSGRASRNFTDAQIAHENNRNFSPSYSFLNPFAWRDFIRQITRGDLQDKSWKGEK